MRPPVHDPGLDQDPRAVADDPDGLVLLEERACEGDSPVVRAEMIGVDDAPGKDERIEVPGVGIRYRGVDFLFVAVLAVTVKSAGATRVAVAPASVTACHGEVSSLSSKPSVSRNATRLPVR